MKKIIFGLLLGVSFTALVGAGIEAYTVSKSTANVETMQGVRVFTDSKPVMEYEYLGTVKMTIALSGKYSEVRDFLIKTAKKKYPQCEAIIINRGSADVVKFK
jgi:hypothetical protein